MSDTGERSATSRPALRMVAAGVVGAVVLPPAAAGVLTGIFLGTGWVAVLAVVAVLLLTGLLLVVAPSESWFGGSRAGRGGWAVAVAVTGTVLTWAGWVAADAAGWGLSRSPVLWWPAIGVLFALVAGVLLRRWPLALGSLGTLVVIALVLLGAVAAVPEDAQDRARVGELLVAPVPGYDLVPHQGSWQVVPSDARRGGEPSPYVRLDVAQDGPDCEIDQYQSRYPSGPDCEVERPGLFFVERSDVIAYFHRLEGRRLVLTAPATFDRTALREALLTARPADPPGTFTATVPGYTQSSATPELTEFTPDDKALLPGARHIEFVTLGAVEPQCSPVALECVTESPGLRYQRFEDNHGYTRVVEDKELTVRGGMAVSRDVLRTAALDARQPTEEEVDAMLETGQPAPRGGWMRQAVRGAARFLFG
ncbi:cytochrome d ubiquinol oxidase subunit II [Lentzea fradiae]|uniref:cytochrome d ubiquinol oxidase subunit II n=1 Tax=Lentzea fradiae TaxID=200378 RepID=UPI00115FC7E4|nr:cytochrome d ubiquinol oxidase subunit II [Lentzea fradiae]